MGKKFYQDMNRMDVGHASNLTSAQEVVPYVISIFPDIHSVIDFGCGTGTWLSVFKKCGIEKITGLDGDWVDKTQLLIDEDCFVEQDLTKSMNNDEKYDLAISLEVAEHLDEKFADSFLDNLCEKSDLIIFGAAVPNQGGTNHVNEQWQSYWVNKFEMRGYTAIDLLRGKFANNKKVKYFYAQNALVYIRNDKLECYPQVKKYMEIPFVSDFILPCLTLSGKFLARQSWRFIRERIEGKG
jgi:SAM-dependent methyltransferase